MPAPHDSGSWVPPTTSHRKALWTCDRKVSRPEWHWEFEGGWPGKLRLDVEDDIYFNSVQAHVPETDIWASFKEGESNGAAYLAVCRRLISRIVADCEHKTDAKIHTEKQWPKQGVFWEFARLVYRRATLRASGTPSQIPPVYDVGQLTGPGGTDSAAWILWCGMEAIAISNDKHLLGKWQKVQELILDSDYYQNKAEQIVGDYRALNSLAVRFQRPLSMEIERRTFDTGECALCP
jgi:hypothetical protein